MKKNPSAVGAPKPTLGGFWRGITRQYRANRVISQTVPHPYMMLMLGRGQWARQGSMRSDAGVSGVYAPLTKGDRGERIQPPRCSHSRLEYNHKTKFRKNSYVAGSLTRTAVLLSPLFIKSCIHRDPAPHSPQRSQMASPSTDGVAEVSRRRRFSI